MVQDVPPVCDGRSCGEIWEQRRRAQLGGQNGIRAGSQEVLRPDQETAAVDTGSVPLPQSELQRQVSGGAGDARAAVPAAGRGAGPGGLAGSGLRQQAADVAGCPAAYVLPRHRLPSLAPVVSLRHRALEKTLNIVFGIFFFFFFIFFRVCCAHLA